MRNAILGVEDEDVGLIKNQADSDLVHPLLLCGQVLHATRRWGLRVSRVLPVVIVPMRTKAEVDIKNPLPW